MHNTTLSFIYVHRNGSEYSYCNNLSTQWPFQEHAWKSLKKQLKPCYSYAIANESFLSTSSSGHNYKPVAVLVEFDSLEEAKAVNTQYYTGYRKIHEDNLTHLEQKNDLLQDYVDTFCEQLLAWADYKKDQKDEDGERIRDVFGQFKSLDFFFDGNIDLDDLDYDESEEDDNLNDFFNM